ncbi:MAG: aminoacetone oxidase family FAD-binding enzyme [Clostridiales bacterium]|nr:aminoacetone oxidase family FAD-binding enzyme [Clostridiales bacterium]
MIRTGIIGGGAAGLFAACFLKKEGASFTLLEKGPECGRKLLLTGHGRCNLTNRKPVTELMQGYHEASKFMKPALSSFTPEDVMAFVQGELGVSLKEEENNRIFPVSDKASDIRDALVDYAGAENIRTGFEVTDIECSEGSCEGRFTVIGKDGTRLRFDVLIMATGGKTFPQTGSDGKSFIILGNSLGHKVTPLYPALTGIPVAGEDKEFTSSLSGVSVYAGAGLYLDNRKHQKTEGNVLFTHDGLSGPAITELARDIPEDVSEHDGWIELDFTPGRDDTEVDKELLEQMRVRPDTRLVTIGADYVPHSVSNALGKRAGVTDITAANITREQRKEYIRNLKHLHLTIDRQPKFETAYVTRGGVALDEINRKTCESKLLPGLYIIGEALDVDGISGGYNLQAAASEAYIAVRGIMC